MEYFALIIPLIAMFVCYKLYSQKMAWWEYILPIILSFIAITATKSLQQKIAMEDVEFWGSEIVEARYYQSWSTWVRETCTRTYECGTSKNPRTCRETYDCSHCDETPAKWVAIDNKGQEFTITKEQYHHLQNKWQQQGIFMELNRDIEYHGSCGKDGDAYYIRWDGRIETSEAATTVHDYVNIVQASHSAFKLPHISKEEAKRLRLFDYPSIEDVYRQKAILGIDSIYSPKASEEIQTYFEYFNAHYGPSNKVKLFVLVFYNKPLSIVNKQQAYWDGGNKNEFVVCLSLDKKTKEVQWTKCFSWTNEKRAAIDVREDFMEASDRVKVFKPGILYAAIVKAIGDKDMHKSFKTDFAYLSIDVTTGELVFIYIITIIITFFSCLFAVKNDIDNQQTF